ncbi:MAG: WXG100 family type VII secretion target [Aggregatilineales bacterium]
MTMLSFSLDDIASAINNIQSEVNKVDDMLKTLQNAFSPIQSGAWQGQGAQAFMGEFVSQVLPEVAELMAAIAGIGTSAGDALNIVSAGDDEAAGVVSDLAGIAEAIF